MQDANSQVTHVTSGPAVEGLMEIVATMRHAIRRCEEWLKEHDAKCQCDYCQYDSGGPYVADELAGAAWAMTHARSLIEGDLCLSVRSERVQVTMEVDTRDGPLVLDFATGPLVVSPPEADEPARAAQS